MLNLLRTALRSSTRVLTQQLPSYKANSTVIFCKQWGIGRSRHTFTSEGVRHFCSRKDLDKSDSESESDAGDLHSRDAEEISDVDELSDAENSDGMYDDHEIFEAFQSELALEDDLDEDKESQVADRASPSDQNARNVQPRDDHGLRPWNTKEREKACLSKLQKGPDGRYINVLEVATELDMLIASFVKLRKKDDPDRADNSDDDEKYIEGIDIEKFKRLQKRLRDGTYKFQPVIKVPLPKRKIVRLKPKKRKKQHPF